MEEAHLTPNARNRAMYLRKNRVRCGDTRRTYLSIAHNVWWSRGVQQKPQSRPVVVASLGLADKTDVRIAQELVEVVKRCVPATPKSRGRGREITTRVAREIRKIEPFLRMLASNEAKIAECFPGEGERMELLESLVRARLADPEGQCDWDGVKSGLRVVAA
jgi:hypothetical protein